MLRVFWALFLLVDDASGFGSEWRKAVEHEIASLPAGGHVVILDVGANKGDWSNDAMKLFGQRLPNAARLSMFMFEPQPWFVPPLNAIANRHAATNKHVELVSAAAWTSAGNLTFFVMKGLNKMKRSRTATLVRTHAAKHRNYEKLVVPAVDLAAFLLRLESLDQSKPLIVLKLDVEGAEFKLVPHLLQSRSLCHVQFMRLEWHLASMPTSDRTAGPNSTRSSFDTRLVEACGPRSPPPVVLHEDWNGQ